MKTTVSPILLAAAIATATAPCLMAETVSQKVAKEYAQKFFNQAYREQTAPVKLAYTGKRLTTDRLFTPFYVYNHPRGGFVIISAENKTFPVLGYSLKSGFDADRLSETERGWLKGYAQDIELIRYDARVPEEAIRAWTDFPQYLVSLLDAPYSATDSTVSAAQAASGLDALLYSTDPSDDGYFSALYTPAQWEDMISRQLATGQDVAIGYVDERKHLYPGVVHGRKGDYYRIAFDRPNDWLLRLMPAEYMGERQVALLSAPQAVAEEEPEEVPFEFHDSFMADIAAVATRAEEERMALQSEPVIRSAGAGHYDILLPENARLAMIYNLNGSHIGRYTYDGQPVAHINIEAEPPGFYFALIFGESGRPYGIKLYR
ncbi:MAG: Spi family protease inhibitor [Muribaculaceae bacterium]|nr:Spi family protease inhibitor [Muribaculaceae bacterium]